MLALRIAAVQHWCFHSVLKELSLVGPIVKLRSRDGRTAVLIILIENPP